MSLFQSLLTDLFPYRNVIILYDFTIMPEGNGVAISTIVDERGNFDGTGEATPLCEVISFGDGQTIKSYKDELTKCFNVGTSGLTLFNKSFEIWCAVASTDGQMASGIQIFGSRTADTKDIVNVFISSTGILNTTYGYPSLAARVNAVANALPLVNGSMPMTLFRVRYNFESNDVLLYINGERTTPTYVSGDMSLTDPTLYQNTENVRVGNISNAGVLTSNTSASNFFFWMKTDKLSGFVVGSGEETILKNIVVNRLISPYTQWQNEILVTNANYASRRADIIDFIFNSGGLPANATPVSINTSYTGLMHGVNTSSLVGAGTVTQVVFNYTDDDGGVWTNYHYVIPKSSGSTNKWLIDHRGHGSEGAATHLTMINRGLAEGFDMIFMAMAKADPDTGGQNTTTNPNVGAHGHEQLYTDGVDTVTYHALQILLDNAVQFLNWLHANRTVSSLYVVGISGGGWSVSMLAGVDERITRTVAVRGFQPRSSKYYPYYPAGFEPDFEQGGANGLAAKCGPRNEQFTTDHPQFDYMLLAARGGRVYATVTHVNDNANFGGFTWLAWKSTLSTRVTELGGTYLQFLSDALGESNHLYQPTELDYIFDVVFI